MCLNDVYILKLHSPHASCAVIHFVSGMLELNSQRE